MLSFGKLIGKHHTKLVDVKFGVWVKIEAHYSEFLIGVTIVILYASDAYSTYEQFEF
jgi:hypothetical protein